MDGVTCTAMCLICCDFVRLQINNTRWKLTKFIPSFTSSPTSETHHPPSLPHTILIIIQGHNKGVLDPFFLPSHKMGSCLHFGIFLGGTFTGLNDHQDDGVT